MKKHYTIIDIAKELGISKSTVSRAFNDRYDVKPETRKAVLELAAKMNFHPNPHAANLVSKKTKIIGVVVPEFINSFYPRIIIAIQEQLAKEGYNVLITQSNEDPETELKNLLMLEQNRVDGILISACHGNVNAEQYERIIEHGTPMVFFSRECPSVRASRVGIDDYHFAFFATERLISPADRGGECSIMHLVGPDYLPSSCERYRGWKDAIIKNKCSTLKKWELRCKDITQEEGFRKMLEWMKEHPGEFPQGIFAFNDPLAIGAMKALRDTGIRIPEDVRIIGFSESKSALIVEPQLSSVAQPLEDIGKNAVRLLLEKIRDPQSPDRKVVLHAKINIRKSSEFY